MKLHILPALLLLAVTAFLASPKAEAQYYIGGTFGSNFDENFGGSAIFGLDDPNMPLRLEAEFVYRFEDKDAVFVDFAGVQSGEIHMMGPFGNIFFDLENRTPVTPYIGGGIGYVRIDQASRSDYVVAYQFMAGASIHLGDNLDIFGGYRYYETRKPSLSNILSGRIKKDIAEAGIRLRF